MGLLSDTKGRKQVLNVLSKHYVKLCILSYLAGVVWLCALSDSQLNNRTYFSENALLPGMVNDDYHNHKLANQLYHELSGLDYKKRIPLTWMEEKMKEFGLHTYRQNFTVQIPFPSLKGPKSIQGTNLYGVLKAPRIASTESVVLSAPYLTGNNMGALALMLSFADHCRRYSYWSKDIIFLVTEEGLLGMQAWVEAYYTLPNTYIQSSPIESHSGSLQSAINLEISSDSLSRVDVLAEGLNGQLPNLDLINMVMRVLGKQGMPAALHTQQRDHAFSDFGSPAHELVSMARMMLNQASGLPTANHGLFHKFRVEAVTLRGVEDGGYYRHGFSEMGRAVEGIYRSLNNLLERFHQSFFFYLLPAPSRYVSIGLYMPAMCLLLLCPMLSAIVLWCLSGDPDHSTGVGNDDQTKQAGVETPEEASKQKIAFTRMPPRVGNVLPVVMATHLCGFILYYSPYISYELGLALESDPLVTAMSCFVSTTAFMLLIPFGLRLTSSSTLKPEDSCILKCTALILQSVMLACIAAINFSLAFFMALLTIPAYSLAFPTTNRLRRLFQLTLLLLASPPALLFLMCLAHNIIQSSEDHMDVATLTTVTIETVQRSVINSLRDSNLLGTHAFPFGCLVVFPNWALFWYLAWQ